MTFRPPPEELWLVAVLDDPTFDGARWIAGASDLAITDITPLRSKLHFESGKGFRGTWCESCQQTHGTFADVQTLTPEDTALLEHAAGVIETNRSAPLAAGTGKRAGPLLDAVLENPASDEARKVYADQLLADNDPRGEFILVDIALAGSLSIRKRESLAARRAHLLAGYSSIWWPYTVKSMRTQRGFLRSIVGSTWRQIAAIAPDVFASEPVSEVGVHSFDSEEEVAAFLSAPWLPRLYRLIVRGLAETSVMTLASSALLANLRALNIAGNELGPIALANLTLPRLQNLVLTGNPIGAAGLDHLRAWPQLANVDTLYLSDCSLDDDSLDRLLAAPLPELEKLTLSSNAIGDAGATVLANRAAHLPALAHLELRKSWISAIGVQALAAAFPNLRRLDVRDNKLGRELQTDPRIRV